MIVEEMAAAIRTCARAALDDVMRALWAAHAAGQVTDDEAESLSVVIEARRGTSHAARAMMGSAGSPGIEGRQTVPPLSAEEGFTASPQNLPVRPVLISPDLGRLRGVRVSLIPCPKRAEARERSRRWASAGRMPPNIAMKFTTGEQAALGVIAFEFAKRQFCDKSHREIGDVAGVSESTVKRAIRQARKLGLLTVQERRLSRYRNDTNVIRIIGKAWLAWIDLRGARGGVQPRTGTNTSGLRGRRNGADEGGRSDPNHQRNNTTCHRDRSLSLQVRAQGAGQR